MPTPIQTRPDYWVMVPFYSNVAYLRETLHSVVAQSDTSWRCVVVDDSIDDPGVRAIVDELQDHRISVVRNPTNLGVAGSFNRCFELAVQHGAELAMILHADDLLEPTYIATVRAAHRASPDAACIAPKVTVIDQNGAPSRTMPDTVKEWLWPRTLHRLQGERGLQLLARGQFFYCPAVSYRIARLTLPAWNARWTQAMDLELYGRILLGGGVIELESQRVFRYRRHGQSMTQLNSATMVRTQEETEVLKMLADQARQLCWRRARRAARWRLTVRLQAMMQAGVSVVRGRLSVARRACAFAVRP